MLELNNITMFMETLKNYAQPFIMVVLVSWAALSVGDYLFNWGFESWKELLQASLFTSTAVVGLSVFFELVVNSKSDDA